MCLNPLTIPTRSRRLISSNRDALFNTFKCNNCVECNNSLMREYQFRNYYESLYTFDNGGFIYYDTLTYSEDFVPKVSHFFSVPDNFDCYCFNYSHLRLFLVNLVRQLDYYGYDVHRNMSHFVTCEYGTSDTGTHRPHYHVLFFIRFNIDPLVFSSFITKCWKYGRTDGYSFQPDSYILDHNVIKNHNLLLCNYVAKYVQKSSLFQSTIDKRINFLVSNLSRFDFDSYSDYKKQIRKIKSTLLQRKFVSHGFGVYALNFIDIDDVIRTNRVYVHQNDYLMAIPLPLYYARKLFYRLCFFNGFATYIPTDSGKLYEYYKKIDTYNLVFDYFYCQNSLHSFGFSKEYITQLVNYLLFYRGRFPSVDLDDYSPEERFNFSDVFCYQYDKDVDNYHSRVYSRLPDFNPLFGYSHKRLPYLFSDLLKNAYFYEPFEKSLRKFNLGKHKAFLNSISLSKHNELIRGQFV